MSEPDPASGKSMKRRIIAIVRDRPTISAEEIADQIGDENWPDHRIRRFLKAANIGTQQ